MALKSKQEYIEGLRRQKPTVYMLGEKIDNIVDHPLFQTGINGVGVTFELATDPQFQHLITIESPLVNEKINLLTHIPQSAEEVLARVRLIRETNQRYICIARCLTTDVASAVWAAAYEIDKKYNTDYLPRFTEFMKYVQKNDLVVSVAMTDVKGNRNKRPSEQEDPDMYLRVVERRGDGIIVRGAKANITAVPYANEMLVLPTRDIRENEKDYAVAFAIPIDTKGVIHICRPPGVPREPRKIERPLSSKFGHVECLVIFDDVFVPWERVFMCGEWDLAAPMVLNFANIHRTTKCGCKAGQIDLMIGTAALMAEYNDVERAAHIQYKLTEMILAAEIAFASGVTAAVQGNKHPSGVFIPSAIHSNVGKFYASSKLGEDYLFLQDIGGGPVVTLPAEKDFFNPETGKWMEKYLKGKEGVPTEHRIRVLKLIEDFTASEFGGWLMGLSTNAAGAPMAERIEILRQYDMRKRKEIAKAIAGIA